MIAFVIDGPNVCWGYYRERTRCTDIPAELKRATRPPLRGLILCLNSLARRGTCRVVIPSWWWRNVHGGGGAAYGPRLDFDDFDSLLEIQPLLVTAPPGAHDDYFVLSYAAEVESEQHAMVGVVTNDQFRNHAADASYALSGDWIRDRRVSFTFDADDRFIPAAQNSAILPMLSSQKQLMENISVSTQFRVPEMRLREEGNETNEEEKAGFSTNHHHAMEMNEEDGKSALPLSAFPSGVVGANRDRGAPSFAPVDLLPGERRHHHVNDEMARDDGNEEMTMMMASSPTRVPRFVYRRGPPLSSAQKPTSASLGGENRGNVVRTTQLDENWYPPSSSSLASSIRDAHDSPLPPPSGGIAPFDKLPGEKRR